MKESEKGAITPETRVSELLESFPQLEDTLVEISPAFGKLRNPVLRKTIARVTTLQQAARVGGVALSEMITRLREAAGLPDLVQPAPVETDPAGSLEPAWLDRARVAMRRDVRPILESGEKPITAVLQDLGRLPQGSIYELVSGFLPVPLMEMAEKRGFSVWHEKSGDGLYRVYFCLPGNGAELVTLEA